eukprot:3165358-Rhodomonas_salina.1
MRTSQHKAGGGGCGRVEDEERGEWREERAGERGARRAWAGCDCSRTARTKDTVRSFQTVIQLAQTILTWTSRRSTLRTPRFPSARPLTYFSGCDDPCQCFALER